MSAPGSLAGLRPRLRPGVLVSEPLLSGPRTVHLVREPDSGRIFEVGPRERFLMERMDGARTLDELGGAYAREFGRRLGEANWRQLLALLGGRGLLAGGPAGRPAADDAPPTPRGVLRGSVRLVADAHATAGRLHRAVGFLLRPVPAVVLLALLTGMTAALAWHLPELVDGAASVFRNPALLLAVATALWCSTALHELGHAVTARHHGGRVGEIGLRWRLPVVIMYCTVDDYPFLRTRWRRIAVAGAGAVTNLLFLAPFFVWWLLSPEGDTRAALAGLLFLGTLQALAMLVPLPPLDGYTIVGQALGATRLAASSRAYLALALRRAPAAAAYPRRARTAYTLYGLCALSAGATLLAALALLANALLTAS
ncbi:M50 family metallopeptidase [Streptomyces avicenniae]|uniref:M50 family metallopeptidase n=1 Tax=Streptomyces avicenniae TaxID=500153 RepID=UPI00069BFF9F|nr:M50 family metallopeptidase [Streptomyces avicenniae]